MGGIYITIMQNLKKQRLMKETKQMPKATLYLKGRREGKEHTTGNILYLRQTTNLLKVVKTKAILLNIMG